MRQIAGDDGKRSVGVVPVDVGDRRIEPSLGIKTVERDAWFDQVRVGDVDKFHTQISSLGKGWRWQSPARGTHAPLKSSVGGRNLAWDLRNGHPHIRGRRRRDCADTQLWRHVGLDIGRTFSGAAKTSGR
jgi:hypothetical protein